MYKLYPPIKPYVKHTVDVQEPHILHVEECGNPAGLPVIFLHGGPGSGCDSSHRQFFDPEVYRIILFDQRGCGLSTPHASLENNHSQALVDDMEVIREHLGIDNWVMFGGSWGSTLALLYAQAFPDRVLGLILRGIFLCRPVDIGWFYQHGASRIYPDYWSDFIKPVKVSERDNLIQAYHDLLIGGNELARLAAAKAWTRWEARCASMKVNDELVSHLGHPRIALSMARIECHYFYNNAFLTDNQLLENIDNIRHIPATLIHGRYDMVCTVDQAYDLHDVWPESSLTIVNNAGHSAFEAGITDALIAATKSLSVSLL